MAGGKKREAGPKRRVLAVIPLNLSPFREKNSPRGRGFWKRKTPLTHFVRVAGKRKCWGGKRAEGKSPILTRRTNVIGLCGKGEGMAQGKFGGEVLLRRAVAVFKGKREDQKQAPKGRGEALLRDYVVTGRGKER